MKQLNMYLAAAALLAAASCSKELPAEENPFPATSPFTVSASLDAPAPTAAAGSTRTDLSDPGDGSVKQVWARDDKIYIVNGTSSSETAYAFTIDNAGAGQKSAAFTAPDGYDGTPAYAVHKASFYNSRLNPAAWKITDTYQSQSGNPTYYLKTACPLYAKYDADDPVLRFRPLMAILRFDLTLPEGAEGAVTRLRLSADDGSTPFWVTPVFDLTQEPAALTPASTASNDLLLQVSGTTLAADRHVVLYLPAAPTTAAAGKSLTIEVTAGGKLYTAAQTGGAITAGKCHTVTRPSDAWTATETYASGNGTSADPYLITREEHLRTLARRTSLMDENWSGKYFELGNNIDNIATTADNPWFPIGLQQAKTTFSTYFYGTFDGRDHTISGIFHFAGPDTGLFGDTSGAIRNLTIAGDIICDYTGSTMIQCGGIAAYSDAVLTNCRHTGSIACKDKAPKVIAGGIVGNGQGTIDGCIQSGGTIEVSGTEELQVGGIAGGASDKTVSGCRNESTIISTQQGSQYNYTGGIIGRFATPTAALHTSHNSGSITASGGIPYAGALVGIRSTSAKVYDCNGFDESVTVTVKGTTQDPVKPCGDGAYDTDDPLTH